MPIIPFKRDVPRIGGRTFIAPDSWIIGQVSISDYVSIFFGATLRGDINRIEIGSRTNIQEHAMLHTSTGLGDCIVGSDVTIGHRAIIHGATVEDNCIIGMGATILDGAKIRRNCIIGANSLVTMNTEIPPGSMAIGSPAKVVRPLRMDEIDGIRRSAEHYRDLGEEYLSIFGVS